MKQTLLIILFLSMLIIDGTTHADEVQTFDKLDTRLGTVQVARRRDKVFEDTIKFRGRTVLRSPLFYINLYESLDLGDRVAVLFGSNPGGHNPDRLAFLVLKPGKKARVVDAEQFESADGTVKSRVKGTEVEIDLGYDAKRSKVARLRGEQLTIEYSEVLPPLPMSKEDCEWLYENSAEVCLDAVRAYKTDCKEFASVGMTSAGLMLGAMTSFANHPGFMVDALQVVCLQECMTREKPTLQDFRAKVCSIK